ncbi:MULTISPECIES: lipoprotein insertase outer membrane protein LolB [Vibrio]|uniref:Outer-membrane lipoprotein LolB n=1 Tax=Vibrio kanaloae TaxID=170673 RepID=A0A4V5RJ97_9VIBR|nr:lipoprotein insertase outer membrane protein LolB [Vibrio kanaloae]OEF13914.1 lipoprotein localization factor LolB [Vibrio kanaloae 5S-149]TKE90976.1 lipoprotein localization protein LolB [Vibrio kanaloae]TKF19371.1 lipoprotein localization protein LolB [Vibrio kanaloae]TKF29410.1 lipoprotein localization protein LolB [Vibrio kanaloae]TKF81318.1 lipoprotein localization protein LolB [Vibrio kanaloae]
MSKLRKITSLLFMTIIMVGCSSIPEQPTSVEWQTHQNRLLQIKSYQASGKLAYISPEQRQSLNFIWKHSQNQSQLRLTTFLGQTVLNLTIDPSGAKVVTYNDQVFTHASASVLVEQLTGLQIPIDHLPQWLLGIPDQADSYQLNSTNTLESLSKQVSNQLWTLNFDHYRNTEMPSKQLSDEDNANVETIPLPTRLSFKQDGNKINIVVSKWTLKK